MMSFPLNQQLARLQASPIRAFNDQISSIEGIIKLTIGEPDFDTPFFIKEAAKEAIDQALNGYTHSRGLPALRQAIQDYMQSHYQLTYDANSEILVTHGATEAIFASLMTLLNPGDKVLAPAPHYAVYGTQVGLAGGELVPIDVSNDNFLLTPQQLLTSLTDHPQAKVLLLNNPCNPTGRVYPANLLKDLAQIVKDRQLLVISDEIYAELTEPGSFHSFASYLPDQTILINGASKSHAMTGWRMGFLCAPEWLANDIFKVHQALISTPNSQAQYAALAAYRHGDAEITTMQTAYQARRDYLIQAFNQLDYQVIPPQGAFYLFAKVPQWFDGDDFAFCLQVAREAKVGLIPGQAFGQAGTGYFRLSYAASIEELQEAMNRLKQFSQYYLDR